MQKRKGAILSGAEAIPEVSIQGLRILLSALRNGSLSGAARALGIQQSTASRRLVKLEDALGERLFDRTPDGLLPTALALELAPHAERVEAQMADIARVVTVHESRPRGTVRLALPEGLATHWVLPNLPGFQARFPEVDVDCVIGHALVDLVRREADLAVRFVRPDAPDLVVRKLTHVTMSAYAHARFADVPTAELPWITFDDPQQRFQETRWVMSHAQPRRQMRVSSWHAGVGAATNGLGAVILADAVAPQLGLVRVAEDLPGVPGRDVFLVYHQAMRDVPRVKAVREWLVEGAAALSGY